MMTSSEIRQQFLDFFASKGHVIVPSAPIVVKNDPTLMFTNAGMNQFKDYFLGNKPAPNKRVADTQKCLRVSGKHNDLEEVGVDTYHHTMFEMLGNWSFGDYFKKEAIQWSWELLTKVYGLDKDRLYVTIFEGDEKEKLPRDEEAYNEWKKWIPEDRILMGNKKDNFWEMGDTGPCGPCTEIHFDSRPGANSDGHSLVNNDDTGKVVEIWNNVFMQFNRVWSDKKTFDDWSIINESATKEERALKILECTKLKNLPEKHVDTGMGLERLVRVIQDKQSNYDTDVFAGTIAEIERITSKKYDYSDSKQAIAFRVIADHIRAIAFTIADGQLPSNTGAGYVIRRILRRAVRYYYSYLDYKHPLLHELMSVLAKQFENVFPELYKQVDFVSKVIKEEEDAFLKTVEEGEKIFNLDVLESIKKSLEEITKPFQKNIKELEKMILPNEALKKSFEQLSFPIQEKLKDLQKINLPVHESFGKLLKINGPLQEAIKNIEKQNLGLQDSIKKIAENFKLPDTLITGLAQVTGPTAFKLHDTFGFPLDLTKLLAKEININVDEIGFNEELLLQKQRSRAATTVDTEDWVVLDDYARNEFIGYDELESQTKVVKYRKVKAKGKEGYQVVLEVTPFYAESGGQVGDTGELIINNEKLRITDTKKDNDLIIHFADSIPSDLNGEVIAKVDALKRQHTELHHSATHLVHAALRKVLGTHVAQKGSLVNEEHLRFDFSHFAKVTDEEIATIETLVNKKIRENIPVVIKEMPKDEAMKLGAMALFGEKYGDVVRVVIIDPTYSVELCGGTHVGSTGELGFFKITHETAVAAGVRRIEAVCGEAAEKFIESELGLLRYIKMKLKLNKDFEAGFNKFFDEKIAIEKRLANVEKIEADRIVDSILEKGIHEFKEVKVVNGYFECSSGEIFNSIFSKIRTRISNSIIILGAEVQGTSVIRYFINTKISIYKNIDLKTLSDEYITKLFVPNTYGVTQGADIILNASGKFLKPINEIIGEISQSTFDNVRRLENLK